MRRLGFFAAILAVLFAAGATAGRAIEPAAPGGDADGDSAGHDTMGSNEETGGHGAMAADPVRGLAVAEHGLRVVVDTPELRRGATERLRFRVRDAGSYRLFADFSHDGEATTLAADLRVDGRADLKPLPAPEPAAVSDGGYDVRLASGTARAGEEAALRFAVTKDGRSVRPEPYLGADGHLVALREGDLAFLHVHPTDAADDAIGFEATFPTTGAYRLFLQFKVRGEVQTVAFTVEVA